MICTLEDLKQYMLATHGFQRGEYHVDIRDHPAAVFILVEHLFFNRKGMEQELWTHMHPGIAVVVARITVKSWLELQWYKVRRWWMLRHMQKSSRAIMSRLMEGELLTLPDYQIESESLRAFVQRPDARNLTAVRQVMQVMEARPAVIGTLMDRMGALGARMDQLGEVINQVDRAVRGLDMRIGRDVASNERDQTIMSGWTRVQLDDHGQIVRPPEPKSPETEEWEERWHRRK